MKIKEKIYFYFSFLFCSFSSKGATTDWNVQHTSIEGEAKDDFYPVNRLSINYRRKVEKEITEIYFKT